jgi:hypothetical protein
MGSQGRCKHSMEKESRTVHDNIKRGVQKQMEVNLLVWLILLQKNRGGSLLKLVVVVLISATPMTTPWQASCFVNIRLYRGLMLKFDDA